MEAQAYYYPPLVKHIIESPDQIFAVELTAPA